MKWGLATRGFFRSLLPEHRLFVFGVGVIGAVIFAFSMLVSNAANAEYVGLTTGSAMTLLQVAPVQGQDSATLTSSTISKLGAIPHVVAVFPWSKAGIMLDEGTSTAILWAQSDVPLLQPKLLPQFDSSGPLASGQVILPENADGVDFRSYYNQDVSFSYQALTGRDGSNMTGTTEQITLKVVGLYDPATASNLNGPNAAYVVDDLAATLASAYDGVDIDSYRSQGLMPQVYVQCDSVGNVNSVASDVRDLGLSGIVTFYNLAQQLPQAIVLVRLLGYVVAGVLGIVSLSVGLSIGSSFSSTRRFEVGLLRSLGWSKRDVFWTLWLELGLLGAAVSVIVVVVGTIIGAVCGLAVGDTTVFGLTLPGGVVLPGLMQVLVGLLVPTLCLWIGSVLRLLHAAALAPDTAMRTA